METPISLRLRARDVSRRARDLLEFSDRRQQADKRHKKLEVERGRLLRRRAMQVES